MSGSEGTFSDYCEFQRDKTLEPVLLKGIPKPEFTQVANALVAVLEAKDRLEKFRKKAVDVFRGKKQFQTDTYALLPIFRHDSSIILASGKCHTQCKMEGDEKQFFFDFCQPTHVTVKDVDLLQGAESITGTNVSADFWRNQLKIEDLLKTQQ